VEEAAALEAWMKRRERRAPLVAAGALGAAVLVPAALASAHDSWYPAIFFNGAVLGHELGHRLAMGWRGRPWLLLATLFGARPEPAGERSRRALFWWHAMGPLFGFAVAAVILALVPFFRCGPAPEWFALGLLALGFLSLLPIPLTDGGRIVDQVLLPRSPLRSYRIQLGAVVGVTLAGLMTMVVVVLVAVPLVVAAVRGRRVARVRASHAAAGSPPLDPAAALAAVREAGYGQLSFPRRRRLAAALLTGATAPPLPPATVALLAVVYLAALATGPLLFLAMRAAG
jgi:hypothetical protein